MALELVHGWLVGALLTILLPLIIAGPYGAGFSIFVYVWPLFFFICLAIYGTLILRKEQKSSWGSWFDAPNEKVRLRVAFLTGCLFSFGWFSILMCYMTAQFGASTFSLIPFTFMLWTIFCGIFCVLLIKHNGSIDLAPDQADYQEYTP